MPVGPRLARALLPHPQPWHLLGATTELTVPLRIQRGAVGWMRSYSHATLPCRRPETTDGDQPPPSPPPPQQQQQHDQQSRASASIFEELFPGEARRRRKETVGSHEHGAEGEREGNQEPPRREEVLEEIQQWLQSEVEAGEAQKKDSSNPHTLRTPKGDWGLSAASRRTSPTLTDSPSLSRPADRYAQPTVLVLSGTTPSLMPSDFFRIAPRITDDGSSSPDSRPVDGWSATNGGIYKIVQDRDPVTLAPRGRYYLYFGSPAAALCYAQEMRELHKLARRAVMPSEAGKSNSRRAIRRRNEDRNAAGDAGAFTGAFAGSGYASADKDTAETDPFANVTGSIITSSSGLAINNEGSARGVNGSGSGSAKQKNRRVRNSYSNASLLTEGSEEQIEALRNFSLVVPTVRLHLSVQMPADANGMYKPSKKSKRDARVTLYDGEALDDVAAADTTTKVLLVLTSVANSTGSGSYSSYVNADGRGVTTIEGLRSLITEDGERRNLPWGVSYGLNGIVPVRWLVDEQNRLMRKAKAAALQGQEQEQVEGKDEQDVEETKTLEQKLMEALAPPDGEGKGTEEKGLCIPKEQTKKPASVPTALWASRVPDLASKTAQMDEHGRFSRFVVSFSHQAEARRFVRSWHRRTVNVRLEHAMSREHMLDAMDAAVERGDSDVNMRVPATVEATVVW